MNDGDSGATMRLVWPQSTADLLNRQLCPACFAHLHGLVCASCQLDLRSHHASELLLASTAAAIQLNERAALIGQIRVESAALARQNAAAAVATAASVATTAARASERASAPAAQIAPTTAEHPPIALAAVATMPRASLIADPINHEPASATNRRSGVQILLLAIGVALVAIALVFFLIIAFFVADTTVRAVIVAALTAVVFGTVSVLARFALHATAQGVAVLATLLVYLDLWGVQATNLFGAGDVSGLWFWGISLLVTAPALLLWFRATGMRAGSIAAFAAIPLGSGLLAGAIVEDAQRWNASLPLWCAMTAVLAGGLVHAAAPALGRSIVRPNRLLPERAVALGQGAIGGAVALVLGLTVSPDDAAAPLWSVGVVALLFALHALLAHRDGSAFGRSAAAAFTGAAGFALAAVPVCIAVRSGGWEQLTWWPALASVAFAVALEAARARTQNVSYRLYLLTAACAAYAVVSLPAAVAIGTALAAYLARVPGLNGIPLWAPLNEFPVQPNALTTQGVLFLVGAVVIVSAVWVALRIAERRSLPIAALWVAAAFATAILIPAPAIATSAYLMFAIVAMVSMLLAPARRLLTAAPGRLALAVLVVALGASAALTLSYSSPWLWLGTSVVIVVLLLVAREVRRSPKTPAPSPAPAPLAGGASRAQRVLLLCAALLGTLAIVTTWPFAFAATRQLAQPVGADLQGLLVLASGVLLVLFALPLPRFASVLERNWALAIAAVGIAVGSFLGGPPDSGALSSGTMNSGTLSNPMMLTAAGTTLAALAAVLLPAAPWNRELVVAKRFALLTVTPLFWAAGYWLFTTLAAGGLQVSAVLEDAWAVGVALIALAVSLAWALRITPSPTANGARPFDRLLLDSSAGIVLLIGLVAFGTSTNSVSSSAALPWLVWLLAACGALLAAIDSTGLFNARTLRHQVGWVALALGTAALWVGLTDGGITAPEPYTLPVAGALLAVAALIGRSGHSFANVGAQLGVAGASIVGVGALLGLVPSALVGANGSLVRPIIVTAVAGVIVLGAAMWQVPIARTPVRGALLMSGGASVALVIGARSASTLNNSTSSVSPVLELWLLIGIGIFLAAAAVIGSALPRISTLFVSVALCGGTAFELLAIASPSSNTDAGSIRAIVLVITLSTVYAVLNWRRPTALAAWVAPVAIGLASLTALTYLAVGAISARDTLPFEWVTIPIAAAMAVCGALRLTRQPDVDGKPQQQSWPLLGAGLLLALVPSAFAGAEGPLLRPILVTVVGGAMTVAAALWRASDRFALLRHTVIVCGGAAVAIATGARALEVLHQSGASISGAFEVWLLLGAGVLLAAAALISTDSPRLCTLVASVTMCGVTALELLAIASSSSDSDAGSARAVITVVALCVAHGVVVWRRPASLASWFAPLSLGLAGLTALTYLTSGVIGMRTLLPFEWVTVPIAAAWIAGGALHLLRVPSARSWPALGGGIALLLVPSLLADYVESPLWRVVGLGILALTVLLLGLRHRLQAPFILGSAVVLLHGLAQLWPWISAVYNPNYWWLWFGLGGVLLIVLAARYEKRVQNVKNAVAAIGSLR